MLSLNPYRALGEEQPLKEQSNVENQENSIGSPNLSKPVYPCAIRPGEKAKAKI